VTVTRVSNQMHHMISTASDPETIMVPAIGSGISVTPGALEIVIDTAYSSEDLLRINPLYAYNNNQILRIFAREYDSVPWTRSEVLAPEFLAYEGAIGPAVYQILDRTNHAGVVFLAQIISEGNRVAKESSPRNEIFSHGAQDWEHVVCIHVPEWEGETHAGKDHLWWETYTLAQFDLGAPAILQRVITSMEDGRLLDPAAVGVMHAKILVDKLGGGAEYSIGTDEYGYAMKDDFASHPTLNLNTLVKIRPVNAADEINPSGMYIMLYFKYLR